MLRDHGDGGVTVEVQMPGGSSGAPHLHPAGEELVVLSGEVEVDGYLLRPGDYLHTPAGAVHRARAISDARFILVLPAVPEYR